MHRRILLGTLTVGLLLATLALSRSQNPPAPAPTGDVSTPIEARNPWSHLKLNNDPDEFHFAIISDRTGGHRGRVFSQAVEQINLLQPEFVLSVGDLIEGYTEKQERINAEWKEFQGFVARLQMPFFYVPGNHDVTNQTMLTTWKEKFGRDYYHFVYRGVLVVALNSDDPVGKSGLGEEQLNWLKQTLEQNKDARWTIVCLHKPLWEYAEGPEKNGWGEAEKLLNGRKYTVFAGHIHRFKKWVRQGMNYYQLATTGGVSRMRGVAYGEFDQIAWVTMKKDGPVIANVLLDGIYGEDMKKPAPSADEPGVATSNRRATYATTGQVFLDGCPLAGARVVFYLIDPATERKTAVADCIVAGDGTFDLSTYRASDGAPAGDYVVCLQPNPGYAPEGVRPLPVAIPAAYQQPEMSPLKATVTGKGPNHFVLELKR